MQGLGLSVGDSTDVALTRAMQATPVDVQPIIDVPDPLPQPGPVAAPASPAPPLRRSTLSDGLLIGGWTLAGAGTAGILLSWAAYRHEMSDTEFHRLQTINDVSWAALGVGVASVIIGYSLPREQAMPGQVRKGELGRWFGGVSPRSFDVGVRF